MQFVYSSGKIHRLLKLNQSRVLTVPRPVHAHACFCWRFWKQIPTWPYTLPLFQEIIKGWGIVRSQTPLERGEEGLANIVHSHTMGLAVAMDSAKN